MLERIIWPAPLHGGPKKTMTKKWLKNLLRSAVVAFTVLIALVRRRHGRCFSASKAERAETAAAETYRTPFVNQMLHG